MSAERLLATPQMRSTDPDWLVWPEVAAFIHICESHALDVRFVGGCVRDTILGREVLDIDAATPRPPDEVMAALAGAPCKIIGTGLKHGTVTVVVEGKPFELTTLRRDVACHGRHAEIAYTSRWEEDVCRRDFTINALLMDKDGVVTDYVGGLADIEEGVLRFIGEPSKRIEEDYLRILRLFRFQAVLGMTPLDEHTLQACATYRGGLGQLSVERIAQEMEKLLAAAHPVPVLEQMRTHGVLTALGLPDTDNLPCLTRLHHAEQVTEARPTPWVRLAALYPGQAAKMAVQWKRSKRICRHLEAIDAMPPLCDQQAIRRALYLHWREDVTAALLVQSAHEATPPPTQVLHSLYAYACDYEPPPFPITGNMLKARGWPGGKALGDALKEMETRWIASDFSLSAEELLEAAASNHTAPQ